MSAQADNAAAVVSEYEVFKNGRNALAFFFYRHPTLDNNPEEGPFWFTISDNSIVAGTEAHYAVFGDVGQNIIATARQRGVIMLVEFEDQQPVRCTPCYLSENF
ncbi:MAG: hypothetical protein GC185_04650 [Alphaproteobacteria bacterium]|nr:hypothetical protein [Alphaproteobacteria bacterium]